LSSDASDDVLNPPDLGWNYEPSRAALFTQIKSPGIVTSCRYTALFSQTGSGRPERFQWFSWPLARAETLQNGLYPVDVTMPASAVSALNKGSAWRENR